MTDRAAHASPFDGAGDMRAQCRAFDWAASPLGAVSAWSQSLRTTVSTLLASRQPMFLFWGPALIQVYNDAYRPSLGSGGRADHALGMRGKAFWTDIWDTIGPQIAQVMGGGPATWFEDQYLPIERNGRMEDVYWTYCYGPVRDDDDTVGGILVVCQETTNRVVADLNLQRARAEAVGAAKHLEARSEEAEAAAQALAESEARFRTVQDASPDASLLLHAMRDDSGRITDFEFTYANDAVQRILIGDGENVVGRTMRDAFPESVAAGRLDRYIQVVETGEPWLEDVHYRRGNVVHGLRVSAVKVDDGVHLAAADLSERIQAAEERERLLDEARAARASAEKARAEAENANRAKSEFLAVMSHELRTPLNAIGGYAELIELGIHGPVTPDQRHALERIQSSQRHLLGLITSVLNYARVEGGVLTYAREEVPLAETITECEALTAPQMRGKRITFSFTSRQTAFTACADREKVRQILLNLLGNAIKFTDPDGCITVRCMTEDGAVAVEVEDTGVGIAPEHLARVFDPFVQVDSKLTRTNEGVGLGLAISRDLARGMGGDLAARSTPGVGSVFTLTLPVA